MFDDIDVFILCGGLGKRLRSISGGLPKPMIRINNRPFLDIIIEYMANLGFRRFILGTGYKADIIRDYYASRKGERFEILFSQEKKPLGTGGAVKKAMKLVRSKYFFVLNGDSFCKFNPKKFIRFHKNKDALVSILLKRVSNAAEFGAVRINKSYRVSDFSEKFKAERCFINTGVYIFSRDIFKHLPKTSSFSLEYDFFPRIIGKGIYGFPGCRLFFDIGVPGRYALAKKYFSEK